ncbi:hypothetical protein KY338_00360 [Candidatus Woesearchaeota archaeon]|nr:hypothetical protein [Candidatus Woesearchaeota archaeon]MBW3005225.1 hypothetical protein [Candidatus Woesearchaeota archaeon]
MSEKTPFIVLTVVFVVGIVGFVLMMTDANTGAQSYGSSIYEKTRAAAETPGGDPSQFARQALDQRALYGSMVQQGENIATIEQKTGISTGQAYAQSGEALGTLGMAGTVKKEDSSSIPYKRVVDNKRGCKVFGIQRRLGQIGLQYAAGTETLRDSIRMLECYRSGEQTVEGEIPMVRSAIANKPLIWGAEDTYCCFSSGLEATY